MRMIVRGCEKHWMKFWADIRMQVSRQH
jgi:hypothetical protein